MPKRKEKTRKKRGGAGDGLRRRRPPSSFFDDTQKDRAYFPNKDDTRRQEPHSLHQQQSSRVHGLDDIEAYDEAYINDHSDEEGVRTSIVPLSDVAKNAILNYLQDGTYTPEQERYIIEQAINTYHDNWENKKNEFGYVIDDIHKPCCTKCEQTCIGKICRGNYYCEPCKLTWLGTWGLFEFLDDDKATKVKCRQHLSGGKRKKRRGGTRKRRRKFRKGTKSKTHRGKDFETRKSSKYYNSKRWKRMSGRRTRRAPLFPWA